MKTVCRVTILGNATREPELKTTADGKSVCTFGLATNRVWKDQAGQQQSLAEFHNLCCWGSLAEFCSKTIKKGKPVYVEGYLKTRTWEDPESQKKNFRTEIIVENVILLSPKEQVEEAAPAEDFPI